MNIHRRNFPGLRQTMYAIPTLQSFSDIASGRDVLPKEKYRRMLSRPKVSVCRGIDDCQHLGKPVMMRYRG